VEEVVRLAGPPPGTYIVRIDGTTVPHGPQPFALASTGSFANWPEDTGVDEGAVPEGRRSRFTTVSPNPFNPTTTIQYELKPASTGEARVGLRVYAVDGRLVTTLVDRVQDPGRHEVVWNGTDGNGRTVASGIYFCELSYGTEKSTRKMTLLK
jgi:hypothetical protein